MRQIGNFLIDEKRIIAIEINHSKDKVVMFMEGGFKLPFKGEEAIGIWEHYSGNQQSVTNTGDNGETDGTQMHLPIESS